MQYSILDWIPEKTKDLSGKTGEIEEEMLPKENETAVFAPAQSSSQRGLFQPHSAGPWGRPLPKIWKADAVSEEWVTKLISWLRIRGQTCNWFTFSGSPFGLQRHRSQWQRAPASPTGHQDYLSGQHSWNWGNHYKHVGVLSNEITWRPRWEESVSLKA